MFRLSRVVPSFVLVLVLVSVRPGERNPRSGPILQGVGPYSAMVLLHRGDIQAPWLELWAKSGGTRSKIKGRQGLGGRWEFSLQDLRPSFDYRYSVYSAEGGKLLGGGSFRSAPLPGQGRVRFAAFGDSGKIPGWAYVRDSAGIQPAPWLQSFWPSQGSQGLLARRILEMSPELVLHLGDLVYPWGRWEHYALAVFDPFRKLLAQADFRPTLGNHDLITERGEPLFRAFLQPRADQRYYSFVRGPVRFFCLDAFSSPIGPGSKQLAWIQRTLESAHEAWKVVYLHRPFFTASRSRKDRENDLLRTLLHPVFVKNQVSLVLSGHDHVYERYTSKEGIHYAVVGGGGKSLYQLHPDPLLKKSCRCFSFILVDADKKRFSFQAFSIDGERIDAFALEK